MKTIQTLDAACDLLRFSRVSMSSLPFNASSRQLVQPPGQAKLCHIVEYTGCDLLDDVVQWSAHCHALQQSLKSLNRHEPPTFMACVGKENIRQLGRLQRVFLFSLAPAPGFDEL